MKLFHALILKKIENKKYTIMTSFWCIVLNNVLLQLAFYNFVFFSSCFDLTRATILIFSHTPFLKGPNNTPFRSHQSVSVCLELW